MQFIKIIDITSCYGQILKFYQLYKRNGHIFIENDLFACIIFNKNTWKINTIIFFMYFILIIQKCYFKYCIICKSKNNYYLIYRI